MSDRPTPPTEGERALKALVLGALLGLVLAGIVPGRPIDDRPSR